MRIVRIISVAMAVLLGTTPLSAIHAAGGAGTGAAQAAAVPAGDVYRSGRSLMLNGSPYRFVGFNAYGMDGCETGNPWTQTALDAYFAKLPANSMTRTWAFQPWGTSAVDRIVASAAAHNQKLILSLADGPSNCEQDGAPSQGAGKTLAWYQSGYRTNYLPWAQTMASRYASSPAIGMWEIMNEPGSEPVSPINIDDATMNSFLSTAAATIKAADPNHLVESGVGAEYVQGTDDTEAIDSDPNIDVGSLHEYDYDYNDSNTIISPHLAPTLDGAWNAGKPMIIGESGIRSAASGCRTSFATRVAADTAKFNGYLADGVAGVLLWNYDPNPPASCATADGTAADDAIGPTDPLISTLIGYTMPAPVAAPAASGTLIGRASGNCLDFIGASTADGVHLEQRTCTAATSQRFTFQATDNGFYEIVSSLSHKCVDVTGQSLANSALLEQWDCWGGDNQQFRFVPTSSGYDQLVARSSQKCMDVTGASTANGALIQQYTCGTGTNQQFKVGP